jgi:hypothetical protein
MLQASVLTRVAAVAAIALLGGCTGQLVERDTRTAALTPVPVDVRPSLSGTWRGSFYDHYPHSRSGMQDAMIEINDDNTFTAKMAGRAAPIKGTVVAQGDRVVLQSAAGDMVLTHSGNTLYGYTHEPGTSATIMIRLDRTNAP